MIVLTFVALLILKIVRSNIAFVEAPTSSSYYKCLKFLEDEIYSTAENQQIIKNNLHQKLIPIGLKPNSLRAQSKKKVDVKSRIIVSTESNNVECRIALGKAPIGSKCVAPCSCSGSQKWIQFSELNKLRRNDPKQWQTCQTCQQKFEYDIFSIYGGLSANLIGHILDSKEILRSIILASLLVFSYFVSLGNILNRVLTSRIFWLQFFFFFFFFEF
jgi:hypothetical protein